MTLKDLQRLINDQPVPNLDLPILFQGKPVELGIRTDITYKDHKDDNGLTYLTIIDRKSISLEITDNEKETA